MHTEGLIHNNKPKIKILSKLLVIIGALNWGLVGILNFDLVAILFGKNSIISKLIYTLVGLSGIYLLMAHKEKLMAHKEKLMAHKEKFLELKKRWHKKGEKKYSGKQYSWSGIP